jgi:hypothetical protein
MKAISRDTDEITLADDLELNRQAWNLPRPTKQMQAPQAPFSVQSGREDKIESEPEAA